MLRAVSGGTVPGSGKSLADRTVARQPASCDARNAGPQALPVKVQGATHCWVQDPPDAPGRWPGLLLRWSRGTSGQWRGQVAYAFLRGSDVVLVEAWLDASLLRRR